jgi:hypothetical protein
MRGVLILAIADVVGANGPFSLSENDSLGL